MEKLKRERENINIWTKKPTPEEINNFNKLIGTKTWAKKDNNQNQTVNQNPTVNQNQSPTINQNWINWIFDVNKTQIKKNNF